MTIFGAAKAELALYIADSGLDVYDYIPARVTPPVVVIRPASPYVASASIGHGYVLNLELVIVAGSADNEQTTDSLDQLIEQVIQNLPDDAGFKDVSAPYTLVANGNDYLAATVGIDLTIYI
jgi:hypothetical protein